MSISKKTSVKKNYFLSLFINILFLLVPLITTPYISRVLGANGIGIYSYCLSIETYFVIIGTLGIPTYAKREIAINRNNPKKLSRIYNELLTLQMLMLSISLIAYVIITLLVLPEHHLMFMMCGIGIIAAAFDVSWLFQGIEDFTTVVKRSIIFKIICLLLIFLLVRNESSLYIYALSLMITNLICNFWLFYHAKKIVKREHVSIKQTFKHFKPAIYLLLPSMVTAIYAIIDKTMLGAITGNMSEVGYYEQSQKIVTVSLAIVTSLGTVLMPRLALLNGENNMQLFKKYLNKGISALTLLSIPIATGCVIISNNLVPWFYGDGYDKIVYLLKIFSPMYIFMGISDLIGTQLLMSIKKEKVLLEINIVATIINLTLNAVLIPGFQSYGAAIATLISEFIKCISFVIVSRKFINIGNTLKDLIKYLTISLTMGIPLLYLRTFVTNRPTIINTAIMIIVGCTVYLAILLIVKDKWVYSLINSTYKKIRRKS